LTKIKIKLRLKIHQSTTNSYFLLAFRSPSETFIIRRSRRRNVYQPDEYLFTDL